MRISDWSSDVCSAGEQAVMLLARRQPHRLIAQADHGGLVGDLLAVEPCAAALDQAPGFTLRGRKTERDPRVEDNHLAAGERERDGSGKRVSVRGDFGGRLIF